MRNKQYLLILVLFIALGLFAWQVYLYFQPHWEIATLKLKNGGQNIAYKCGYFAGLNARLIVAFIIFFAIRKPLNHSLLNND